MKLILALIIALSITQVHAADTAAKSKTMQTKNSVKKNAHPAKSTESTQKAEPAAQPSAEKTSASENSPKEESTMDKIKNTSKKGWESVKKHGVKKPTCNTQLKSLNQC